METSRNHVLTHLGTKLFLKASHRFSKLNQYEKEEAKPYRYVFELHCVHTDDLNRFQPQTPPVYQMVAGSTG